MPYPASTSAASMVAANAGVPMKTRPDGFLEGVAVIARLPRTPALGGRENSAALCLGEFAQNHPTFDEGQVVDKQNSVEVFDLVLQASGEKPLGMQLTELVLLVQVAQSDLDRAGHVGIMLGQRQTTLTEGRKLGRAPQDLGVGELERLRLLALARDVENDEATRLPDLRRRKPDTDRLIHRVEHVVHQLPNLGVDGSDGPRFDFEPRVGSGDDRELSHGSGL